MTFKTFLRSCGASTLAAALAVGAFAAPAAADDAPGRRGNVEGQNDNPEPRAGEARQRAFGQRPERQRPQVQAAPQMRAERQAEARQQRTWQPPQAQRQSVERSGRDWNRGDRRSATGTERAGRDWNRRDNTNNDWGQARAAQVQAQAEARRAQAEAASRNTSRTWSRGDRANSGEWERNRTYANRDRNGSYRDGYRDGRTVDSRQDRYQQRDAYRSGYRDGTRNDSWRDGRRHDGRHYSGDYRRWSHDWRRDNRYNWYSYRSANRHLYRIGRYYAPYSGYRYSRISIGFHLDSLFFGSRYWINDPWQYRLPAAYGPYRWVRYYDDALLVDIYSGEVVDVIYDFFW
ncbi:hypothetical protein A6F68_02733 [Tsuneonella dongtanensis]|uniref:Nickel/cobalt transporter regulator n=1 Tax=Tsuneonella dongtanensis TaxID=692370 RepID=A0A1B2AGE1_9SPHN|nr:RcnB family protein [Tsuneonella dongtanensis]ANY21223.1 hypothetical protein A6F68_02733 [Tsuneonella dongtanensis]